MATATAPIARGSDQATTPRREAAPGAPAAKAEVFWADWLALCVWFVACALMWGLQVLDILAGLFRK
jgi:hypothetical protein